MKNKKDVEILRELAARVAEIATLPSHDEKRVLWRKLNALKPDRPMVMIDQVCWNEMNADGQLTLRCADQECRSFETILRRTLFQWEHFPVDMVVEPYVPVRKAIKNSGFGVANEEQVAVSDPTNSVRGHKFINQFERDEDLEKVRMPRIQHDEEETARRLAVAHELFDGILEVRPQGADPYLSLWDPISSWMSVEGALYAMVDRPDFMHRLVGRMTEGYLGMLDQLQEQGLLCEPQSLIHCTGAWTDELPAPGYNPRQPRTKDIWMFGLAQMFCTVSPAMFKEFEVDYASRICARFGLVYYGCCDPLDRKMNEVRQIPNVRKVSMSPWTDEERGAAEIAGEYVFSRKPNPAMLAWPSFNERAVREHLRLSVDTCARHGCPLELILKDISTVNYEPKRLFDWARIAMEIVQG